MFEIARSGPFENRVLLALNFGGSKAKVVRELMNKMHYLVTGGAGFIGSNLVDRLLFLGNRVTVYDNFSTGRQDFLTAASGHPGFQLVKGDLLDTGLLAKSMKSVDFVFHLAANADVRFGTDHPGRDLEQNTVATFNVLEAMRAQGVTRLAFSSTGSVYGEAKVIPTPEDAPFPLQTSLYGASKLAGEGLISAYCEGFGFQATIFRFVSILGPRYTHGHIFDFCKRLLQDPSELRVLGNGKQKKSYLHVEDCMDAILLAVQKADWKIKVFNLGTNECIQVDDSIGWISNQMGISPKITYTGGERGWIGDNPHIFLDCSAMRELGWKPRLSIRESVAATLTYLLENRQVLERA